jgi:hypothetical protein
MRRLLKRWWLWSVFASLFAIIVATILLVPYGDPISETTRKIETGMTKAQVIEIMGRDPVEAFPLAFSSNTHRSVHEWCWWSFGNTDIIVLFHDGRVASQGVRRQPTLLDQILDWINQHAAPVRQVDED